VKTPRRHRGSSTKTTRCRRTSQLFLSYWLLDDELLDTLLVLDVDELLSVLVLDEDSVLVELLLTEIELLLKVELDSVLVLELDSDDSDDLDDELLGDDDDTLDVLDDDAVLVLDDEDDDTLDVLDDDSDEELLSSSIPIIRKSPESNCQSGFVLKFNTDGLPCTPLIVFVSTACSIRPSGKSEIVIVSAVPSGFLSSTRTRGTTPTSQICSDTLSKMLLAGPI
jgi:hypothetical protein